MSHAWKNNIPDLYYNKKRNNSHTAYNYTSVGCDGVYKLWAGCAKSSLIY